MRGKMYSGNVVFFRSVLFPNVQNDSIPTIGHSDIYLFLIPIMSQVGPGSGPSGEPKLSGKDELCLHAFLCEALCFSTNTMVFELNKIIFGRFREKLMRLL